jgi:nitrite reductase/ring-hydroxylating ferredoxin subunit
MINTDQKRSDPAISEGCHGAPKWRTDFPIEWEGDHYVSRREMVKFLTLGSLLLAAANWITALAGRLIRTSNFPERLIGSANTLDEQRSLLFRYPTEQDPCIAVRTPQGKLVAYSQVCTHLSCAVVYSRSDNKLLCPCHKGVFNVIEGAPIGGPPTRRLPRVLIEQRGDQLYATGVEV